MRSLLGAVGEVAEAGEIGKIAEVVGESDAGVSGDADGVKGFS
jgi:hypothetical protein